MAWLRWVGVVGRETEVSDSESKKIHALAGVAPPLRELVYCAVCSCMYVVDTSSKAGRDLLL